MPEQIEYTETVRGYRIDIIRDEDAGESPRGDCQNGVMLVRESGEHVDPDEVVWRAIEGRPMSFPPIVTCAKCDGRGGLGPGDDQTVDCDQCDGYGKRAARTWADVEGWAKATYGATSVLPLDARDDWAGRTYGVRVGVDGATNLDDYIVDGTPCDSLAPNGRP